MHHLQGLSLMEKGSSGVSTLPAGSLLSASVALDSAQFSLSGISDTDMVNLALQPVTLDLQLREIHRQPPAAAAVDALAADMMSPRCTSRWTLDAYASLQVSGAKCRVTSEALKQGPVLQALLRRLLPPGRRESSGLAALAAAAAAAPTPPPAQPLPVVLNIGLSLGSKGLELELADACPPPQEQSRRGGSVVRAGAVVVAGAGASVEIDLCRPKQERLREATLSLKEAAATLACTDAASADSVVALGLMELQLRPMGTTVENTAVAAAASTFDPRSSAAPAAAHRMSLLVAASKCRLDAREAALSKTVAFVAGLRQAAAAARPFLPEDAEEPPDPSGPDSARGRNGGIGLRLREAWRRLTAPGAAHDSKSESGSGSESEEEEDELGDRDVFVSPGQSDGEHEVSVPRTRPRRSRLPIGQLSVSISGLSALHDVAVRPPRAWRDGLSGAHVITMENELALSSFKLDFYRRPVGTVSASLEGLAISSRDVGYFKPRPTEPPPLGPLPSAWADSADAPRMAPYDGVLPVLSLARASGSAQLGSRDAGTRHVLVCSAEGLRACYASELAVMLPAIKTQAARIEAELALGRRRQPRASATVDAPSLGAPGSKPAPPRPKGFAAIQLVLSGNDVSIQLQPHPLDTFLISASRVTAEDVQADGVEVEGLGITLNGQELVRCRRAHLVAPFLLGKYTRDQLAALAPPASSLESLYQKAGLHVRGASREFSDVIVKGSWLDEGYQRLKLRPGVSVRQHRDDVLMECELGPAASSEQQPQLRPQHRHRFSSEALSGIPTSPSGFQGAYAAAPVSKGPVTPPQALPVVASLQDLEVSAWLSSPRRVPPIA